MGVGVREDRRRLAGTCPAAGRPDVDERGARPAGRGVAPADAHHEGAAVGVERHIVAHPQERLGVERGSGAAVIAERGRVGLDVEQRDGIDFGHRVPAAGRAQVDLHGAGVGRVGGRELVAQGDRRAVVGDRYPGAHPVLVLAVAGAVLVEVGDVGVVNGHAGPAAGGPGEDPGRGLVADEGLRGGGVDSGRGAGDDDRAAVLADAHAVAEAARGPPVAVAVAVLAVAIGVEPAQSFAPLVEQPDGALADARSVAPGVADVAVQLARFFAGAAAVGEVLVCADGDDAAADGGRLAEPAAAVGVVFAAQFGDEFAAHEEVGAALEVVHVHRGDHDDVAALRGGPLLDGHVAADAGAAAGGHKGQRLGPLLPARRGQAGRAPPVVFPLLVARDQAQRAVLDREAALPAAADAAVDQVGADHNGAAGRGVGVAVAL